MRNYQEKLAEAAQKEFSRSVTGFLFDARLKDEGVRGAVFRDALNRYEDGDTFTSSKVLDTCQEHGYTLFMTQNGSVYVAVSHLMFIEDTFDGVPQTLILRAS
ncbi:hypothetical protein LOY42_13755 [Pseudomonas sp. B21-023]|uniref:hypothetical protein n=1 Tax=unclassified Pseudomonas TaxID=196821 RepID=UPI0015535B05|nr:MULTISPECIES: hypothetical protein [unclassified Pseudomonas]NQD78274.1 hypothetical protein [Pseudomonas sp. CM27]UVM14371.1 hypothetical protein LOY42_13755 [Pseudomonas sp. B21-023]